MRVLIVVIMGRWFSVCIVCQVVQLYSVVEIVVMSGEVACCNVVCGTLVGVSVFSVMCSEYAYSIWSPLAFLTSINKL